MPSLHDELKLRTPFASLEQEAQLSVVRTGAVLNDDFEQVLKPYGLSIPSFNVLRILRGAEPDLLCRNEIRDRMLSRMPDMTRLLDRMEASGLVTRIRGNEDRRMVATRITDKGRKLLAELDPVITREQRRRFVHLSEEQLRALIALLTLVRG